jgi:hypothetical protein
METLVQKFSLDAGFLMARDVGSQLQRFLGGLRAEKSIEINGSCEVNIEK